MQRTGTGHGSPWDYDRRVPLVFLGGGSPAEVRDEPVRTVDVLPTLLARAGLAVPEGLEGRVLPGARGAGASGEAGPSPSRAGGGQ